MKSYSSKLFTCLSAYLVGNTLCLQAQSSRPNILFIMSDDHSAQAISAYNGILAPILPTPNLDRIATEGVKINNCFATNSISTPSRACIMTGQYNHKNGVYTLSDELDPGLPTVSKELQKAGYQTAVFGKWHLGTEPQGFDYYNIFPGQGRYKNPQLIEKGDWDKGTDGKPRTTEYKAHSTDVVTDETIKYIESISKDQPFFVMCHFKAPHRNWQPAERFKNLLEDVQVPEPANLLDSCIGKGEYAKHVKMYLEDMVQSDVKGKLPPADLPWQEKRHIIYQHYIKDYLRCIAGIDENVGRILDYLDKNGLTENTIVVYTSDQGFFLGEHGMFDKRFMYEETIRMPLLIRYPKKIKQGSMNDDIILNIDFAPFFLDCAGCEIPEYMQGESFRNNLQSKTPRNWRKSMYYRYWMHWDYWHHAPAQYGIRTDRYKLIYFYNRSLGMKGSEDKPLEPNWELYDLKNDPMEMNNVYNEPQNAKLIRRLKSELLLLKERYDDKDDKYPVMMELNKTYW